jgi:hypothetical protein
MTSYFPSLSQIWDRIRILKFNLDVFSVNFCTFYTLDVCWDAAVYSFDIWTTGATGGGCNASPQVPRYSCHDNGADMK